MKIAKRLSLIKPSPTLMIQAKANALKAAYNLHRASTTYHESADSTNTVSSSNATTIASLITLAAELQADITAHLRNAPVSAAVR